MSMKTAQEIRSRPPLSGTPQTLHQAISNGLRAVWLANIEADSSEGAEIIESHVRDFLSQRFTAAYMGAFKTFEELWMGIKGKKS